MTDITSECFVVQSPLSSEKGVFVGRNSYRSAAEAVEVLYFAANAEAPATQKCSHLEVSGSATFAVILNRPAGVWGADSGANEKKIAVAVTWSRDSADGLLTATDLTRLALERSATVAEAIDTICALAAEHNADADRSVQQCFVIAGEQEAWLLNVIGGTLWAAERIAEPYRAISAAGLSVHETLTRSSEELQAKALDLNLWNGSDPFDLAAVFAAADTAETAAPAPAAIAAPAAPFGLLDMFALLRTAATASDGCQPPPSASQVLAVAIDGGGSKPVTCHWFTATPNPAESVFKPFVFTRSARISPLTQLQPEAEEEAASAGAGGGGDDGAVTRLHRLHAQRNGAKVGVLLRSLEESCVQEVHNFLSAAEAPVQELDELLKDCVEAEVKFYR